MVVSNMEFDTVELGAGSYPDAPEYPDTKTMTVECHFKGYVSVPVDCEDPEQWVKENCDQRDLLSECDKIEIDWVH